jgi:hypothetical protein
MVVNKNFQEISAYFEDKMNGMEKDRKMNFYSAHDTNIQAYLTAFNLTSYECLKN